MRGILGLLTGWVLLLPLLVMIYLQLGGPPFPILWPFAHIAASVPMLGFSTFAGIAVIFFSIRSLTRPEDPLTPPR